MFFVFVHRKKFLRLETVKFAARGTRSSRLAADDEIWREILRSGTVSFHLILEVSSHTWVHSF